MGPLFRIPGPEVIKPFSSLTQLSTKFILINAKMPTIVGILICISKVNTTSERIRAKKNFFIFRRCSFYEQLKIRAQLS